MRKQKALLLLGALSISCTGAGAAGDQLFADAQRLVALMKDDTQIDEAKRLCREMTHTMTAESVFQASPSVFAGISPGSKLWPSVVEAFQEFYNESCSYMDRNAFLDVSAKAYASLLSRRELAEAIKFYSSPIGRKLANSQVVAGAAFQKEAAARLTEAQKRANARFIERVSELAKSDARDRK